MMRRVDIHVRSHPDRTLRGLVDHREGQHGPLCLQVQTPLDLCLHAVGVWNRRIPKIPQLAILHRLREIRPVSERQRHQIDVGTV